MPNVYSCKVFKSLGGRSGAKNQWSNIYHFTSAEDISGPAIAAFAARALAWEKTFHLNAVNFMRAVVTLVGDDEGGVEKGIVRTFDFNDTGSQGTGPAGSLEPLQMTLRVKFQSGLSRGKGNFYRGVLTEGMVSSDGSGDPGLTIDPAMWPFNDQNFQNAFMGTNGASPLVLVSKRADQAAPTVNPVTKIASQGVTFRKRTVRRKPKNVSDEAGFLDTLIEIGKAVGPLLVFAATKGKALPAAPRLQLMGAASGLTDTIDAIINLLTPDAPAPQ